MSILIQTGMRLTPARLNAGVPLSVRKGADETVNNSAALQDDNHLVLSVVANAVYEVTAELFYASGTTPDFRLGFTYPTAASMNWFAYGLATAAAASSGDAAVNAWVPATSGAGINYGGPGAGNAGVRVFGTLVMGSTAGSLRVQWAQAVATVADTIVRAGSFLIARRLE